MGSGRGGAANELLLVLLLKIEEGKAEVVLERVWDRVGKEKVGSEAVCNGLKGESGIKQRMGWAVRRIEDKVVSNGVGLDLE